MLESNWAPESNWRERVREAVCERDINRLRARIAIAEESVSLRLQSLDNSRDSQAERTELADAANAILRLQIEKLHFPELTFTR